MKSITFPEVTNKIAEHQEEFNTVHVQWDSKEQGVGMCFELSDEEVAEIVKNKKIWYKQIIGGGQMHPMRISAFKNDVINEK